MLEICDLDLVVQPFGACGDVVRNTTCCPAPIGGPARDEGSAWAQEVARRFRPASRAYTRCADGSICSLERDVTLFQAVLMLATGLCSLVAGFLFAFAVVVMPGIRRLDDAAFIRTFQAIDRVIQDGQPLFLLVWVGSVLALTAFCLFRVLTLPAEVVEEHLKAPLDIDTQDTQHPD